MAEALSVPTSKTPKGILPPDPLFILKGDMGPIHSVCFPVREYSSYCSSLLASTEDGFVHFWNLDTNRRIHKQKVGESVQALHSIEDDLITQEKNGTLKSWTLRKSNYHLNKTVETYGGFCKSVLINTELVVAGENSMVDIIDITNMEKTRTMNPQVDNIGMLMSLTNFEMNGKTFVLGAYETGDMILWDFETAQAISHLKLTEHPNSLSFDPYTCRGVVGNTSNIIQIFHIDRNSLDMSIKYETGMLNDGVNVIKIREDGKVFVAGCYDNKLRYFSWKTLRVLAVLNEHKKPVSDLKFSPMPTNQWNTTIMAAGSQDGTISLWNLYM